MPRIPTLLVLAALATSACNPLDARPLVDINVIDRDTGQWLPEVHARGQDWIPGDPGHRYSVRLTNTSGERVLVVLSVDGAYYLLIGPDWEGLVTSYERTGRYDPAAYRRTRVLASHDPLHFGLDGLVTVVDAHAAEVIVDEEGRRWLSHCGWGQRGVFLAPLTIEAE